VIGGVVAFLVGFGVGVAFTVASLALFVVRVLGGPMDGGR
jgi:hypothetical protein